MKKIIITITSLFLSNLLVVGQTMDLKDFETFLGKEKSAALNQMNNSFEEFLKSNFPDTETENARIYKFLEGFTDWSNLEKSWIIDSENAKETLEQFENSGLRIEYWKYGYESYEPKYQIDSSVYPKEEIGNLDTLSLGELNLEDFEGFEEEIIPITNEDYDPELEEKLKRQRDSSQTLNLNGQFFYGLLKYGQNDSLIKEYTESIYAASDISTSFKAGGLTVENLDLSKPLRKRLIVMDFYYHFLKWNLENKKTTR